MIDNQKVVLIVAAHSDDEAIGCCGTILRHINNGDAVHLLFMTDGISSRIVTESMKIDRLNATQKAAKMMGVKTLECLSFPDNKMDSVPLLDIIKKVEEKVENLQPNIIYTHHVGDLNIDHQVTHRAVLTACRPQPEFCVKEIYAFEVLSSTEWNTPEVHPFSPTVFVDITKFIDIKKQILAVYIEEMKSAPHSRSIQNIIRLNQVRGNAVGLNYAEAFALQRLIK
jgi:N-acetylglucosamine malate deacetylase 1